jgi:hypothetical protein
LFPGTGSGVDELAVAVFEIVVPAPAVTLTTMVTVTAPEGPIFPTLAVTVPFVPTVGPLHVPRLATQETNVVPVGSGSLNPTFTAVAGPLFVTTTVYVMLPPLATGSGVSAFVTERSAPGSGVTVGVGVVVGVTTGVVGVGFAQGSWYWKALVAVSVHVERRFVTETSTV